LGRAHNSIRSVLLERQENEGTQMGTGMKTRDRRGEKEAVLSRKSSPMQLTWIEYGPSCIDFKEVGSL